MSEDNRPSNQGGASIRPVGKRQVAGVATTSAEYAQAHTPAKTRESEDKVGGGPAKFLPEVAEEMKKVIWPTGRQMLVYTAVVLAFLIAFTALVAAVDFVAGLGVEQVLVR